ncbi:MAG TPA: ATP-binding protein, partial [Holophagaceae bacterium]|nr:ATP-binding protein [Holophagaceae bacterium]
EERWQLALEANRDGIWDLDPVQGQVWFSPRWKEILGYGEEELPDVLATFEDRIHPAELAEVQGRFRAFLAGEGHTYAATFRMRHRDGSWRWILSRGSAVRDPQGRVIRVVGSHADITEQRAIESTLRESEARAQAASRAKSSFLANMSHELRTPLSAILGYTRLLARDDHHTSEERAQLHHILEAGEHLLALINDVLSLSKIEAGRLELKPAPFSTSSLFSLLEGLFGLSMRGKGLAFTVDAKGFPELAEADEPKLRQVLVNLLGNALKFTEAGSVTLEARWSGGRAWFTVADTGSGIAPEDQAQIFQAFSQTERGAAAGGTGLGLHLSQALVRLLGGEIQLLSAPGEGSRFTFEIPLPAAEAATSPLPEPGLVTGLVPGESAPLVLVVDDRLENRDILQRLLTRVGLRVRLAEDGAQALARWATDRPDLVLMDLRMPRMDGFGAVGAIRAQEQNRALGRTPVVAISASVYDVSMEELRPHGFDDFLVKPIEEARLFACLERFLGIHFVRREAGRPKPPRPGGLEGLAALPQAWREAFRALVAMGDLEAAEATLGDLQDEALVAGLRERLRAYQIQDLISLFS